MAGKSTEDCFHEERDYLGLYRIETKATTQTWIPGSPVLPGHVWCYTHGRWENKEEEA